MTDPFPVPKPMRLLLSFLLLGLAVGRLGAAVDFEPCEAVLRQAEPALAAGKSPARVEAMASIHRMTLGLGDPAKANPELQRRWFARLREKAQAATDPEVVYFLQTELRLDPAGASFEMLDPKPVAKVPYEPGQGVVAQLADVARSLDLGETPRMTSAQLKALVAAPGQDPAVADRALVLLRRLDPASAAPLLWTRLLGLKRRSEVMFWEDQIARLPVRNVGSTPYDEQASPAAKAAWLRLAASRPSLPVSVPDRAGWIALLKGPANENTEAAWDAAPRVFGAADRAELEALAKAAPERVAARARLAIARLR